MLCLCTGTGIILMFNVTNLEVFVGVKTFVSKGTGLFPPHTISHCHSYGANLFVSLTEQTSEHNTPYLPYQFKWRGIHHPSMLLLFSSWLCVYSWVVIFSLLSWICNRMLPQSHAARCVLAEATARCPSDQAQRPRAVQWSGGLGARL